MLRSPLLQVRVEPSNKKKALTQLWMMTPWVSRSLHARLHHPVTNLRHDHAGNLNDDEQSVRTHPVFIRLRTAYAVKFIMFTIL